MNHQNEELYINCDGINVHAKIDFPKEQSDHMPILVIIPGFTGHIEETHIVAVAKAANEVGFVTLRSELYGHGHSDGEFYDHTVLLWMAEAMRVISYARNLPYVSDVYVSGHSQGGLTTVLAAGMMSDIVKAAIPMSPAMSIPDDAWRGETLGVIYDRDHLPDSIRSDSWEVSSNYVRAARMLPVEKAIRNFTKPVLITHGTADEAIPYSYAEKLAHDYADATLVPIEGDTHCYDHHLDQVIVAVKKFLQEQASRDIS